VQKDGVHIDANPNEVKAVRFVTQQELKDLFAQAETGAVKITPWFRLIVESFLFKWWDDLESLDKYKDDKVHKMI
jgi:isopentenyl-diphosphate delta-isomerase